MMLVLALLCALVQELDGVRPEMAFQHKNISSAARTSFVEQQATLVLSSLMELGRARGADKLGSPKCPCIGFSGIPGETPVTIDGQLIKYPADIGSRCEAWDDSLAPKCAGASPPSWCKSSWCYVDPRHCHIPVLPKLSPPEVHYQAAARYQYMPLFFSYSTCEAEDTWSKELSDVGTTGCRCIGVEKSNGTKNAAINGTVVKFPADVGGRCKAWDEGVHPACIADSPPEWCGKKWCNVDPCSCSLDTLPQTRGSSSYFADGNFQGKKPLFFSYATCGEQEPEAEPEDSGEDSKKQIDEVCSSDFKQGYGNEKCKCIGLDGMQGNTSVIVSKQHLNYPANLGAKCEAFDDGRAPACRGESEAKPAWCTAPWCYVDPKLCDIETMPKYVPPENSYQPTARYQHIPLYYSYSTCGAKDSWASNLADIGKHGCRCIGFDHAEGKNVGKIANQTVEFPAQIGGECKAWDESIHPDCKGSSPPTWCAQKWCFVDACACSGLPVPPKTQGDSRYFPNATFQGRPIFYSYATCGGEDHYTSKTQVQASREEVGLICSNKVGSLSVKLASVITLGLIAINVRNV